MDFLAWYVFAVIHSAALSGKDGYPQNYFGSPIDIPITLIGNFGEPRAGHFHTGLDIRTNQEVGHKVFAAADGYISRINVSGSGYGNALYIAHPNGYVTVYAHLLEYNPTIMKRLRKEQYAKESFAVDFNLPPGEIPVKKGEEIALSGSTGSAAGPHLHFEIRDAQENAINPLLFGYDLKDNIKPLVSALKFYPEDELKNRSDGYRANLVLKNGNYEVPDGVVKLNDNKVGISVNTIDEINLTNGHIGIYQMKMYDNKQLVYEYEMDKISFDDKRYVLSHIDYPLFLASHKIFHKCFVDPGNKCPVYSNLVNRGIIDLSDDKPHNIKIEVSDEAGNTSVINLVLQHDKNSKLFAERDFKFTTLFFYNRENEFSNSDVHVKIPNGCLFDDLYFKYSSSGAADNKTYSKIYQLDNSDTQVFDWFTISVKTENLAPALRDKAVLVCRDKKGNSESWGGKFEDGFITAKTRSFGAYFIKLDTTPPKIVALNIRPGRNMRAYKNIRFRISDNLSGVAGFDTYLDGKWTVTDYDAKSSTLTHTLDPGLANGEHIFNVVVTDERHNQSEYSVKFKM